MGDDAGEGERAELDDNGGAVEIDETYIGATPRYAARRGEDVRRNGKGKAFDLRKTGVVGGVECDGGVRARVVRSTTAAGIAPIVVNIKDTSASLMTGVARVYHIVDRKFFGRG